MKNRYFWFGIVVILIVVSVGIRQFTRVPPNPFVISPLDSIKSWDFNGAYTGNPDLEAKANLDISRLKGMFGEKDYPDYEIYVSIANQYELLGDGRKSYDYLGRALAIDSETTGLAWHNIGQLMAKLGAYESARIALSEAVKVQPLPSYYLAKIDFLERYFPNDEVALADIKEIKAILKLPYDDSSAN